IAPVAAHAGTVTLGDRRDRGPRERAVGTRALLAVGGLVDVALALAVAARAAGRAPVGDGAVLGLADGEHRIVVALVVAARALRVALEDEVLAFLRLVLRLLRERVADQERACQRENQALKKDGQPTLEFRHALPLISRASAPAGRDRPAPCARCRSGT